MAEDGVLIGKSDAAHALTLNSAAEGAEGRTYHV